MYMHADTNAHPQWCNKLWFYDFDEYILDMYKSTY